ncbi:hypothetical protein [Nocardioides sp. SYSU DS0663]|uniref:hypothetical protein n=1 Tax=Nocardioides sp. SYSU DS0663 TaxID=3416445 RepID=UPI003F4BE6EF
MAPYAARLAWAAALAAALPALGACSDEAGEPVGRRTADATADATADPSGAPTQSAPAADELDWQPLPGSVRDTVTTNGTWTLTVPEDGSRATLTGPDGATTTQARARERVSDAFLDDERAVVVLQDRQESRPARAVVTELGTREEWVLDGGSPVPTTTGGTWAMGAGTLVHATVTDAGRYCLASVDLAARTSERGWCAPARHGFNGARVTAAGTTLMTFDDSRPSCRTVAEVRGTRLAPFEDAEPCKAWDAVLPAEGVRAWSVVPQEGRVESALFRGRRSDGQVTDLGPGSSGTLVGCGGAAWFVRDPVRDGEPARLMRWTPEEGLTVAYETAGSPAFLAPPRCGGSTLNVTALSEGGDEQVFATLGAR